MSGHGGIMAGLGHGYVSHSPDVWGSSSNSCVQQQRSSNRLMLLAVPHSPFMDAARQCRTGTPSASLTAPTRTGGVAGMSCSGRHCLCLLGCLQLWLWMGWGWAAGSLRLEACWLAEGLIRCFLGIGSRPGGQCASGVFPWKCRD